MRQWVMNTRIMEGRKEMGGPKSELARLASRWG